MAVTSMIESEDADQIHEESGNGDQEQTFVFHLWRFH